MVWTEILAVGAIIAMASLIQSSIGFGLGMVAMPLLGMLFEIQIATPLVTLIGLALGIIVVARSWKHVEWKSLRYLLVGSVVGIPAGIFLLRNLPSEPIRYTLGALIILFAVQGLVGKQRMPFRPTRTAELLLGLVSGAFSGGFSIGGPPIIAYGAMRGWAPSVFRATLQAFFIISSMVALVGHGVAGLLSGKVLSLFAVALPVMIPSIIIGRRINARIDPERFRGLIYLILLLLGILLLVQ